MIRAFHMLPEFEAFSAGYRINIAEDLPKSAPAGGSRLLEGPHTMIQGSEHQSPQFSASECRLVF